MRSNLLSKNKNFSDLKKTISHVCFFLRELRVIIKDPLNVPVFCKSIVDALIRNILRLSTGCIGLGLYSRFRHGASTVTEKWDDEKLHEILS